MAKVTKHFRSTDSTRCSKVAAMRAADRIKAFDQVSVFDNTHTVEIDEQGNIHVYRAKDSRTSSQDAELSHSKRLAELNRKNAQLWGGRK